MAVARDATGTIFNQTDNTAGAHAIPSYTGLTVVSNTNGAILYIAHIADTTASPATGAALATVTGYTLVGAISSATANSGWVRTEIWAKVGNSTGAQTIACNSNASWSINTQIQGWAVSWTGVNQSGGASSFANVLTVQGNTSNPSSGPITKNASADATVSAHSESVDVIAGPNKTQLYLDNANAPSSTAQFETGGASTQTHTWTYTVTGNGQWALVALDMVAAGGGAAGLVALKHNFRVDKFKTPFRSMGPNAGLFQVRAFPPNPPPLGWMPYFDQLPSKSIRSDLPQAQLPIFTPPTTLQAFGSGDVLPPRRLVQAEVPSRPIFTPPQTQASWGNADQLPPRRRIDPDPGPFQNTPTQVVVAAPTGWLGKDDAPIPRRPILDTGPMVTTPPPFAITPSTNDWMGFPDIPVRKPPVGTDPGPVQSPPVTAVAAVSTGWLSTADELPRKAARPTDQAALPVFVPQQPTGWLAAFDQPLYRRPLQADVGPVQFQPTAAAGIAGMAWAGCEPGLLPPIPKSWLLTHQSGWPPQFVQQIFPQVVAVYSNPFIATPGPMTSIPGNPPS